MNQEKIKCNSCNTKRLPSEYGLKNDNSPYKTCIYCRQERWNDPIRKKNVRDYYLKNEGYIRKYNRDRRRKSRELNPDLLTIKDMYRKAKKRAELGNYPFDIELSDLQIPAICPVLGISLIAGGKTCDSHLPSIDKIIPELGYVKGNIRIISYRANTLKNNGTLEELEAIVDYIKRETINQTDK